MAANLYQDQLSDGLDGPGEPRKRTGILFPLFSNVGLLGALVILNKLVLDSSRDSQRHAWSDNKATAAVNYAAWKVLLPSYFKWVPVDPTTESQSQNFDNFYPGAIPAGAGEAGESPRPCSSRPCRPNRGNAVSIPRVLRCRSNHV